MRKLFKNLIVILGMVLTLSVPVMAEAPIKVEPKVLSVQETISYYAKQYGVSEYELLKVSKCESSYRPNIYGDGTRAFGIFQYHKPTFIAFSKLMGEQLDYYSYNDQAKLTSWVWKHYPNYKSHWTCSYIVGILS